MASRVSMLVFPCKVHTSLVHVTQRQTPLQRCPAEQ